VKYQKSGAANAAGLVAHAKSAVASDPNTLVLTYAQPVANVLSQLQQFFILPAHVWSKYTTNGGKDLKTFKNAAPIVSGGPFTLKSFKKNEIALFKRYPDFYGPKPHIDGFGLRQFSNDDALVAALKANEIDAIESLPPTAIKTVKDAGFVVEQVPGLTEDDFIFNSNPKKTKHRELLNLKLREAFAEYQKQKAAGVPAAPSH